MRTAISNKQVEDTIQILKDTEIVADALRYAITRNKEIGARLRMLGNHFRIQELIDIIEARREATDLTLRYLGISPDDDMIAWRLAGDRAVKGMEQARAKRSKNSVKTGESHKG